MPDSPAAYHEIVRGGEVAPINLVPPSSQGTIEFGRVFLSLGAPSQIDDVSLSIIQFDGSTRLDRQPVTVRQGRREVFELQSGPPGGFDYDALAVIDMTNVPPGGEVAILVEWDSP